MEWMGNGTVFTVLVINYYSFQSEDSSKEGLVMFLGFKVIFSN